MREYTGWEWEQPIAHISKKPMRSVAIALDDGRSVRVDSDGHITVCDADDVIERELDA